MDDPLSRALSQAPEAAAPPAPDVVHQHTELARPIADVLRAITDQITDALALPFFDGATGQDTAPIVQVGVAEAGSVHISASHVDPPYKADIDLYVRNDKENAREGHYQVRARCVISCDVQPPAHRDFAIGLTIGDDASVTVDVERLRSEMAAAIRSIQITTPAP